MKFVACHALFQYSLHCPSTLRYPIQGSELIKRVFNFTMLDFVMTIQNNQFRQITFFIEKYSSPLVKNCLLIGRSFSKRLRHRQIHQERILTTECVPHFPLLDAVHL